MGELSKLPNIGKEVERQLETIGIKTQKDLVNIGSREAWKKIKAIDESACYNRLIALEGAIWNINKSLLPNGVKEDLKEFYNLNKN